MPTADGNRTAAGLRLPAEWEPQAAVMLTWPHAGTDWADQLAGVEALYTRIAARITAQQQVLIVCRDLSHRAQISARLTAAGLAETRVRYAIAPSNDSWARDHGPITVIDDRGSAIAVDFRFNGWGGRYRADRDDRITESLHRDGHLGSAPLRRSDLVLEGGAIDSDGRGTLLAMRRTLIDAERNPGWSREEIETELGVQLGVERMLWLEHGRLSGDDTDGHIDMLARFCDAETICFVDARDPARPDHAPLIAMQQELLALRQRNGLPYRLIPLPLPAPSVGGDENQRPASYANFLVINGAVLAPVYADPNDRIALERLGAVFPDRDIIPVDCRALIQQGGSLHCITMQLPAASACKALA